MAVLRQLNLLGQMRLDAPHARLLESAVVGDFDLLAGIMLAGRQPLILQGFNVSMVNSIGQQASNLSIVVSGASLIHYGASESGSLFSVPVGTVAEQLTGTNPNVLGSFQPSTANYIGIDLVRETDDSTADVVQFRDAATRQEVARTVALARTLQYRFIIQQVPFSTTSNVAPVAIVSTDAANNVTSITDARSCMFRLGSGSDTPDAQHAFPWVIRTEPALSSSSSSINPFAGGDRQLTSLKDWMDACMTRLWELGGGEAWYSPTADRGVKLIRTTSFPVGANDNFLWDLGGPPANTLYWTGLAVAFDNSTVYYNTIQDGDAVLAANGDCLYVDVNRYLVDNLVPVVGNLISLGTPAIPGCRMILAWRYGDAVYTRDQVFATGEAIIPPATNTALGSVQLRTSSGTPATPRVPVSDSNSSVVCTGLSRSSSDGGSIAAGDLNIGAGANDRHVYLGTGASTTGVDIGINTTDTTVYGRLLLNKPGGFTIDGTGGIALNIGPTSFTTITLGRAGQAVSVASSFAVTGGDCTIPAANDYKHAAAKTYKLWIDPTECLVEVTAGAGTLTWSYDATHPEVRVQSSGIGDTITAKAHVKIPQGATVTSINWYYKNNTGGNVSGARYLDKLTRGTGAANWTSAHTLSVTGAPADLADPGAEQISVVTDAVAAGTLAAGDHFEIAWTYASAVTNDVYFYGAEITYTITKVEPNA